MVFYRNLLLFYLIGYINTVVICYADSSFYDGFKFGLSHSSAGALTPFPKIAGTAGALFGFMQILGGAGSSSLVALSQDQNQLPIAIPFIMTALLSILIFHFFKHNN